jgi:hypothetical protein
MPKVIIIPFNQVEKTCQDAVTFANKCQSDFSFYCIPPDSSNESPLKKSNSEFIDILTYLDGLKLKFNYSNTDLILAFFDGILSAFSHGLSNLFMAGTNYNETPACTGVISLKYLDWGILEEKYNYEIQKHSILHLIVCGIIGAYTHVPAHIDTYGCLLDRNDNLKTFNKKLEKGYYLCSDNEGGCYEKIKSERYGNAILKLCESFKESNSYKTIIKEVIMGDKFENISNSTIINRSHLENALNKYESDTELKNAIQELKQIVENSGSVEANESFNDLTEEMSKPDSKKSKLKAFWTSLTSSLPSILTMTNITEKIVKLIE